MSSRRIVGGLLCSLLLLLPGARAGATYSPVSSRILAAGPPTLREVALTFDDGPSVFTPQILAVLHHFDVHATFFLVGRLVPPYRDLVRAEVTDGDLLGNHTYSHADLMWLSNPAVLAQLTSTQAAIQSAVGITPHWFRPPYGAVNLRVSSLAASVGLQTVLWSVDPRDWARPGVGWIVAQTLVQVHPGSVIIMHDGGGDRSETVAALPLIITILKARGYQFVTLDTLFAVPGSACDVVDAMRWFGSAGIPPETSHGLYRSWQGLYCSGTNLGPASSGEYRLHSGAIAQNFSHTAHRLVWDSVHAVAQPETMWSWAIHAFSLRGIQPVWHTPITQDWFDQYVNGYDWGPALAPPEVHAIDTVQRFAHGVATERAGKVTWSPS